MRILVDYRPALRERTGVGEYMHELVRAYAAAHRDEVAIFSSSWRDRLPLDLEADLQVRVVDRKIPVRALNYLWHRLEWPSAELVAGHFDVVHAAHPLLIPARTAAQVVTIHDLHFLDQPARARAEIRRDYVPFTEPHARRADAIVTPSNHVKQLVVERFGVAAERIYVCQPGPPAWQHLGHEPHVPSDGYILFIGTLETRKNLGTLLDAYAVLRERRPNAPRLVLAGRATPDAAEWLKRLTRPPLVGQVVLRGYVSHDEREQLYAGAQLLVLPSFDEGFGLPALEAMSAGIPVVVSKRGALPEVVGPAGTQVDPDNPVALADAIDRLVGDRAYAIEQAGAGLARAREFSWASAAEHLHHAYVDALVRRRARAPGTAPSSGAA